MMTFLPYPNFVESFKVLDYRRLGKQRVESLQILNVLTNKKTGWKNHPIVSAWEGYEDALKFYHDYCILEWKNRGYKNNMPYKIFNDHSTPRNITFPKMPWWIGNEDLHRSHRARLIEKMPEFYEPIFPNDKGFNNGKYFWPVMKTQSFKII